MLVLVLRVKKLKLNIRYKNDNTRNLRLVGVPDTCKEI